MKTALGLIASLLLVVGCASQHSDHAQGPKQSKATVIDVRTPDEYAGGHVKGSTNIPLSELTARIPQVVPDKNAPIMVHCQAGGRSARAKAALDKLGYTNVTDLGSLANARAVVERKGLD